MITPIYDFVKKYSESRTARFHMPGHKGEGLLGCELFDITEIKGADVLYSAEGIIHQSECNLSSLYGTAHSFYSTEGSTLAIKAMLALVSERRGDEKPLVLAARNVHAAFVRAAAILDLEVSWIYDSSAEHLCSMTITAEDVEAGILSADRKPRAVCLTSPDYLGNISDISAISKVCRSYDIPLLVDNAHGAYLKFLEKDAHPITLGAAMCADSAHKTLPVLTGGAYLHISPDYAHLVPKTRDTLSIFASTSPSYLTLCSLDLCNKRLAEDYPDRIRELVKRIVEVKSEIASLGFEILDSEPLKIVIRAGESFADKLRQGGIEPEFSDSDFTVLMFTPENSTEDFQRLISVIKECRPEKKGAKLPIPAAHESIIGIREAIFSPSESISVKDACGRISASPTISCPPAIPIVISGERITKDDIKLFEYYGIESVSVVKDR